VLEEIGRGLRGIPLERRSSHEATLPRRVASAGPFR
jgi:hypothetical protein